MKTNTDNVKERIAAFNQGKERETAKAAAKIAEIDQKIAEADRAAEEAEIIMDFETVFAKKQEIEKLQNEKQFYTEAVARIEGTYRLSREALEKCEEDLRKDVDKLETEFIKKAYRLIGELEDLTKAQQEKYKEIDGVWRSAKTAAGEDVRAFDKLPAMNDNFADLIDSVIKRERFRHGSRLDTYKERAK